MRPKLKDDVFYIQDGDDVLFQGLDSSFKIHGKGVYPLISKVIPFLDGKTELDRLLQAIPPHLSEKLKEIIQVLEREGFIRDLSFEQVHTLTQKEQELYESTIRYINYNVESAHARFEEFRRGQYCIVSSGRMLISMIDAACEAGVEKVFYVDTAEEVTDVKRLEEIIRFHKKRDLAIQVKEINKLEETKLDLVLYFSKLTSYKQMEQWFSLSKKLNIPFLPVTLLDEAYFVGPLSQHHQQGCFECAWRRWNGNNHELHINQKVTPTATAILSHLAWLESIKYICDIKSDKNEIEYHYVEPTTLQSKLQKLIPHPFCENCKELKSDLKHEYQKQFFEEIKTESMHHAFTESIVKLFDEKSGILLDIDQDFLVQTPLFQSKVRLNALNEGSLSSKPSEIIASGFTNIEARVEVVLNAIEQYAKGLLLSTHKFTIYDISTKKEAMLNHEYWTAIGCGRSYEEAIIRGILRIVETECSSNDQIEKLELNHEDLMQMSPRLYNFLSIYRQKAKVYQGKHFTSIPITEVILETGEVFSAVGVNNEGSLNAALKKSVEYIQNSGYLRNNCSTISTLALNMNEESEEQCQEILRLNLNSLLNNMKENGYSIHISPITEEILFNEIAMFGPYRIYMVDKNREGVQADEQAVFSHPR